MGGKQFVRLEPPIMGSEDVSYFAREIPAVMLWLGAVPENVDKTSVHSLMFIVDEKCIPVGIKVMSAVIHDYLEADEQKR
jgi:amidohydrolase